jgi:hypothetical protein
MNKSNKQYSHLRLHQSKKYLRMGLYKEDYHTSYIELADHPHKTISCVS